MLISIVNPDTNKTFPLDVSPDMEISNVKALCEFETNIASAEILLMFENQQLNDGNKTLQQYGIKDGDLLILMKNASAPTSFPIDFTSVRVPSAPSSSRSRPGHVSSSRGGGNDPENIRQAFLSRPGDLAVLRERNPPLADVINDTARFAEVFNRQQAEKVQREISLSSMLSADPMEVDIQRKIEEEIRQANVDQALEQALEHQPETFATVIMLYISCKVNGHDVKAFVDSGAQMTMMSKACAERCNLMRLIDTRWSGIAKGVGEQRILGRVHFGTLQIGSDFLAASFSILEDQQMDMLLGLDMLKRHQCSIDLKKNLLVIGSTSHSTSFLSESELPHFARQNSNNSAAASGPGHGQAAAGSSTHDNQMKMEEEDRILSKAIAESSHEFAQTAAGSSRAGPGGDNYNQNSSSSPRHPSAAAANGPSPSSQLDSPMLSSSSSSQQKDGPAQNSTAADSSSHVMDGIAPGLPLTAAAPAGPYSDEMINKVTSAVSNVSRQDALAALGQFNGDINEAIAFLLVKSFQ